MDQHDRADSHGVDRAGSVTHDFDKEYWDQHWDRVHGGDPEGVRVPDPNLHLVHEVSGLVPGTALDAGCGEGGDAVWLASLGWQVTAADIASEALTRAARGADRSAATGSVQWVEADLSAWEPSRLFDLVTTSYAHAATPQLDFYRRLSTWVAPGGTLVIVGHLHHSGTAGHGHHPPAEASVTPADIVAVLDGSEWDIVTAVARHRAVAGPSGQARTLHDVVVRAVLQF